MTDPDVKSDVEGSPTPTTAWKFRLHVAGATPACEAARENLQAMCETYLRGRYLIEIVDLLIDSAAAEEDHIFAVPTVLRISPAPAKKVIGDLSDRSKALASLNIPASGAPGAKRGFLQRDG